MAQDEISKQQKPASRNTRPLAKRPENVRVGSFEELLQLDPKKVSNLRVLPRHAKVNQDRTSTSRRKTSNTKMPPETGDHGDDERRSALDKIFAQAREEYLATLDEPGEPIKYFPAEEDPNRLEVLNYLAKNLAQDLLKEKHRKGPSGSLGKTSTS
jgi:hypothetical protein